MNKRFLTFVLPAVLLMTGAAQATQASPHASDTLSNLRACASNTARSRSASCEDTFSGRVMEVSDSYDGSNGSESDFRSRGIIGAYTMEVRSDDGTVSDIRVVSSSVFHPTGTRIRWGMKIKAVGHTVGNVLTAREITVLQYSPQ